MKLRPSFRDHPSLFSVSILTHDESMTDQADIEVEMATSEDNKTITITFRSSEPMETNDFLLALEAYLTDLTKAAIQKDEPSVNVH